MSENNNKDKIKEILEGHNKKFTLTEIVVGIIVVLIVGVGVGYAIFKLLAPPPTPQIEYTMNSNEIVKQPNPPVPPSVQPPVASSEEASQPEENGNESNTYASESEKSTSSSYENSQVVEPNSNSVSESGNTENNNNGPQIITPLQQKKNKEITSERKSKRSTGFSTVSRKKHTVAIHKEKSSAIHKKKQHVASKSGIAQNYVLWVSSNSNRKFALLNLIKLRKCGHKAFSKEVNIKGKTYTRVYVGPIKGYMSAKIEAREIRKQLHLSYMPIIKRYDKVP